MPACLTAGLIVMLFFTKFLLIFSIIYLTFNSWSFILPAYVTNHYSILTAFVQPLKSYV